MRQKQLEACAQLARNLYLDILDKRLRDLPLDRRVVRCCESPINAFGEFESISSKDAGTVRLLVHIEYNVLEQCYIIGISRRCKCGEIVVASTRFDGVALTESARTDELADSVRIGCEALVKTLLPVQPQVAAPDKTFYGVDLSMPDIPAAIDLSIETLYPSSKELDECPHCGPSDWELACPHQLEKYHAERAIQTNAD